MTTKKQHGPKDGGSYVERAQERWGNALPDWVTALARALDTELGKGGNQTTLNARLKFSGPSVISAVIGKTYPGKLAPIEAVVRGVLLKAVVDCPVIGGEMPREVCAKNQKAKFATCSPLRARFVTTCPSCPNFVGGA
jgi:hypothetical protein